MLLVLILTFFFSAVLTASMAKVDLRLQRIEEVIVPVRADDIDDFGCEIQIKNVNDVISLDLRLIQDKDFRRKTVSFKRYYYYY